MADKTGKLTCFIAMPVTTSDEHAKIYDDPEHWAHVQDHVFVPAVEAAGFTPVLPVSQGSSLIHADIVRNLMTSDMALVDLSSHNPNVFFELGVRTAANRPIAVVRDDRTSIPFDMSGVNMSRYKSRLNPWETDSEIENIRAHLLSAVETCNGSNPMWERFGLEFKAEQPSTDESSGDAKLDLMFEQFNELRRELQAPDRSPSVLANPRASIVDHSLGRELAQLIGSRSWSSNSSADWLEFRFQLDAENLRDLDHEALISITRKFGWFPLTVKHESDAITVKLGRSR